MRPLARIAVMLVTALTMILHSPVAATDSSEQGLLLAGGVYQDCESPYVMVVGRHEMFVKPASATVGVSAICFEKPGGITGYHLEYTPTVPCTFPASLDQGDKVLVYGSTGVINQPFTLVWDTTTSTYTPPPSC